MTNTPVSVLVVDDQASFRALVRDLLASVPDFEVVGEAEDAASSFSLVEQLKPDLVLMDIEMPKMNGLDAASYIKERHPGIKIVLMTAYHLREYQQEVKRRGLTHLIPKERWSVELLRQAVGAGDEHS